MYSSGAAEDDNEFDWLRGSVRPSSVRTPRERRKSSVTGDCSPPKAGRNVSSLPVEQLSASDLERRIAELQNSIAELNDSRQRTRSK